MKRLFAILTLVIAAITHVAPAQAQGTGDYYYAESTPGTCPISGGNVNLFETHVCSFAETYATYTQAFFLHSVRVKATFSGPDYTVWDSHESNIVMPYFPSFRAAVSTPLPPYSKCAHSGWHDVRSIHSATLYGDVLHPGVPLWDYEQYAALLVPYCDCTMEIP